MTITKTTTPHSLFEAKTKELTEIHKELEKLSIKLTEAYKEYEKSSITLKIEAEKKVSELVKIIQKEHPDWSIRRIAYKIGAVNDFNDGFNPVKLYRRLKKIDNEERRKREIRNGN